MVPLRRGHTRRSRRGAFVRTGSGVLPDAKSSGAPKHHSPQSHSFAHSVIPEPHNVIPAKQAVSKPLSLWERVAEGRCDPSQTQPLSLWERVAEGRVRAPNNPAAPIHCR